MQLRVVKHFEGARENAVCVRRIEQGGQGSAVLNTLLAPFRVTMCGGDGVSQGGCLRQDAADAAELHAIARKLFLPKSYLAGL